ASFSAIPGWGTALMGITALAAEVVAAWAADRGSWLAVWLAEAAIAIAIGVAAMARKARRTRTRLLGASGRRFLLGLAPAVLAGAVITLALARADLTEPLPGLWLLLYGCGLVAGGGQSVRVVPAAGACFMALGTAAMLAPWSWGDAFMAAGFGGLSIVFGTVIGIRHGG
ncbi:MAG: hypothetical protein QOK40_377, partial [Miltoncostaeaceae bacterium]|nr:hypothetical protein [Miltoncostaeaceae bacterium]